MKHLATLLFVCLIASSAYAQIGFSMPQRRRPITTTPDSTQKPSFRDRLYFGGGGGLGGGTDANGYRYFYYSLFPVVGYRVTPQFSVGTGFTYIHYHYSDVNLTLSQYGFSPFMRYNFQELFFQVEYDRISAPGFDNIDRQSYNRLLFGVGYSVKLGKRSVLSAMVMYDVLYKRPSVFASPIVPRVFMTF